MSSNPLTGFDLNAEIDQRIVFMPLLPAVVGQLLKIPADDPDYLEKVYRLAAYDPTLAARIVEYAGRTIRVAEGREKLNLRYAVARLGVRKLASLIITLSMAEAFPVRGDLDRALWLHSLQVAVVSRWLTLFVERDRAEHAYLAGLLHDIGRFVVFQSLPDVQEIIGPEALDSPRSLLAAEFDVLGTDHVEIGSRACRAWGLPETIVQVVELHHDFVLPCDTPERRMVAGRVAVSQIADALSMIFMSEQAAELEAAGCEAELLELCRQQILRILDYGYAGFGEYRKHRILDRLPDLLRTVRAETRRSIKGLKFDETDASQGSPGIARRG